MTTKIEAWIDRLENDFTAADEAASEILWPVRRKDTREIVTGSPRPGRQPASDLETRLADQVAMLSSARWELARTEQLVEMMKAMSAEIRALREDIGRLKGTSAQVGTLRHDVDEIKDLLTSLRDLAAARRKTAATGGTDTE